MADKSEAEINAALAEILAQVTEAEYTPYNLTCAGDPALQAGDWVKLTGVSNINGPEFEYSRNSPPFIPKPARKFPQTRLSLCRLPRIKGGCSWRKGQ